MISDIVNEDATSAVKGPSCSVCKALADLPDTEAAALRQLLADPRWRYSELSDRLEADPDTPLRIHSGTLARHARGHCSARERLR